MVDIAHAAGVSQTAVSAVLSGTGSGTIKVGKRTAAKIRHVAQRLGFHPNQAARQLAGKRSGIIGAVAKTWRWQTEKQALGWLNEVAAHRDLKILAWQMDAHKESIDSFVDECIGWNIDGLVCLAFKYDSVWPEAARAMGRLPRVVSILGDPGVPGGYTVEIDAAHAVRQCVEHLRRRGCRRIVQVLEGNTASMDQRRLEAFEATHREFYGPMDKDQVCFATEGWRVADYPKYQELAKELVVDRRADGLLLESDFSAPGLLRAMVHLGRKVPEDVAVIGWGYEAVGLGVTPSLTTVDFDYERIMGAALDLLTAMVERPGEEQPRTVFVAPKLVVRETA